MVFLDQGGVAVDAENLEVLRGLGTDGFGRSDGREELRDFFEVDARYIVAATLKQLASVGEISNDVVAKAVIELKIDPGKLNPHVD